MTLNDASSAAPAVVEPTLSPLARAVAVFVRPGQAWTGLGRQVQWWFPVILTILVSAAGTLALHERALIPMLEDQWEQQVADGLMPADRMDGMLDFMRSPAGIAVTIGQQVLMLPIFTLFVALLVWFGVGFVLGTRLPYRLALEVAAWSGLVSLPGYLLTAALAWMKESYRGVHVGFGILLPESDAPSKLMTSLGVVLDGLGPFSIWYLAVGILGAAALSGASRRSVAWVLGGIYLAMVLFGAGLAAMFGPNG
jgi:hypothetical protein